MIRSHIQDGIGCLSRRDTLLLRGGVIRYLRGSLDANTTRDVMDNSLEANILKKIPKCVSEMYEEAAAHLKLPQIIPLANTNLDLRQSCWVSM